MSLSEDRRLREREYEVAARQVFLPNLTAALPSYPVRVGDSWRVARKAVTAILGESEVRGEALVGKFIELRRDPDGATTVAVIGLNGRVATSLADTVINGHLYFAFPTPAPGKAPDPVLNPGSAPARPLEEA